MICSNKEKHVFMNYLNVCYKKNSKWYISFQPTCSLIFFHSHSQNVIKFCFLNTLYLQIYGALVSNGMNSLPFKHIRHPDFVCCCIEFRTKYITNSKALWQTLSFIISVFHFYIITYHSYAD